MKREDYKAIKHMNKEELEAYLKRIYERGYREGVSAVAREFEREAAVATDTAATASEG